MPKAKNKRNQPGVPTESPKRQKTDHELVTPPPDNPAKTISSIGLCDEDIELAIDTLNSLTANPAVIKTKACKDLRTAVYKFSKACTTGLNATSGDTNLTAKISGTLADGKYTEARILLAEMGIRRQKPKLGTLCRWVRDLDVVSGLAEQLDEDGRARTEREEEALMALDAVLRLTGPTDYAIVECHTGCRSYHGKPGTSETTLLAGMFTTASWIAHSSPPRLSQSLASRSWRPPLAPSASLQIFTQPSCIRHKTMPSHYQRLLQKQPTTNIR
jgi:hypothetical protein